MVVAGLLAAALWFFLLRKRRGDRGHHQPHDRIDIDEVNDVIEPFVPAPMTEYIPPEQP
jgi:hypothetical protein